MQIIETEHLTKYYGKTPVVDSLSLSVPEGSVYGFIGPNGAGKSTTMKMLLGLVKPNSGSIRLLGKSMTQQNRLSLLRQTGSLIESPACYGHLTGEENLQILAELKNVPERNIDRVLEIVELTDSRRRKVQQYSLGMRQRLGIAQALLGNAFPANLFLLHSGLVPALILPCLHQKQREHRIGGQQNEEDSATLPLGQPDTPCLRTRNQPCLHEPGDEGVI